MANPKQKDIGILQQGRLQMADLARMAGVSTSTVSRALNHSPLVNDETRIRIEELARSLKYSINIGAQNLRLKQNRTVAVVVPYDSNRRQQLSDPFFLSLLGSLIDALAEQGFDTLISRVDGEQLDAVAQPFDSGRVIGIILIGQWRHHDQLNQLAARHVPIVVWGTPMPQQLYCTIGADNVGGGMLATEHLIEAGRRRIVFIGDTTLPDIAQRYEGYCNALKKHKLAVDPQLQVSVPLLPQAGREAVQEMARRNVGYDAIFACSDMLAVTAINALRERDLRIPHDVAVVGYGDIELSACCPPPLTSMRQPIQNAGRALVAALLSLIEGNPVSSQQLTAELMRRATSDT